MLFYELKRQAESHASCHHRKGQEHARHEILPLEGQDLIDTQTGESPASPHQHPDDKQCLAGEPDETRNIVHHGVEATDTDVQRCPSSKEDGSSETRDDDEVQILSKIEVAEAHTTVFSVVTGGQLTLSLCQVERTTVGPALPATRNTRKATIAGI